MHVVFVAAVPTGDQQGPAEAEHVLAASPMMQVEGFLMALTNSNKDGRVVVHRQGAHGGGWFSRLIAVILRLRSYVDQKP